MILIFLGILNIGETRVDRTNDLFSSPDEEKRLLTKFYSPTSRTLELCVEKFLQESV